MAVKVIAHKPELTKEQAREIFRKHFEGTYEVTGTSMPFRDFSVNKSAFTGVALKLEQNEGETKFVYAGWSPKWWARILFAGLIGALLLASSWNKMTKEVEAFIDTAPEFR